MQAVEVLGSYISQGVYTVSGPFHPFGGAVDIIVVQQQDGSFRSSPWYVRFGKFQGVLKTKEKVVSVFVNGTEAGFRMCLDHKGEAYFLRECESNEGECMFSSPTSADEADGGVRDELHRKIQSCDYKSSQMESASRFDVENGKLVERTNSSHSTIFGLVFGRKMKKEARLGNIPRIDSLERAEIAADLLETKWSTNLPANVRRSWNSPRSPLNKDDKDVSIVGEESNKSTCDEALGSIAGGINDKSASGIVKLETPDDIAGQTLPCLTTTHQEVVEIHRSGIGGDVAGEVETIPKVESHKSDAALADSVNNNPVAGFLSSNFAVLSNGLEHVLHERDNNLVSTDSINQGGGREVSTYVYCETFERSTITFDNAAEKSMGLSLDRNKQAKLKGKVVHENSKLNTEINSRLENGAFIDTGNYSESESFLQEHLEKPSCTSDSQTEFSRGTFDSATANCDSTEHLIPCPENLGFESASSPDVHIQGSKSILEATQQDMMKEECIWNEMGNTAQFGSFENQLKREGTESTSDSQTTSEGVQPLNSSVVELHSISDFPNIDELKDQAQEAPKVTLGAKADVLSFIDETSAAEYPGISSGSDEVAHASITLPNAIEDDQFLLYNNDNCTSDELHSESITTNEAQLDVDPLLVDNIDAEEHLSNDTTAKMPFDILSNETSAHSDPICIPRSVTNSKAADWLSRSLPNSLSHTHDRENSDAFDALGQSLPLNSRISEPGVCVEGFSSSQGFDAGSINKMVQVETTEMTAANVILESSTTQAGRTCNPTVELSLCKHLLFEGMGAKAASQAFDSEKIDLGMYAVLGPSVVKNNKLIVRIGSRYFPWDAAAPIILGMVSFGQDQIFDTKGMIAVDEDERAWKGDRPKAIVSSGGTWNLWPFSLRKPRTRSTDNLVLNEQKGKESDVVLEDSLSGVTNTSKRRIMKKHVKSLGPSSEQLASLCLKEGQNLVTFKFETAMLGKQQVDARIYLWKWNTRIVVSDVDGTITKSDVLGQFMPLVGKDWSQTGVAHFFSSIKDNGYQFLYLSARAISQASLTRQFLFNLKQDGKALPDGPVVISPDGLFPSFYREVIRRAPHEFKISCLEDIKAVFPPDCNPFYAGFGNRHTDEISYLKAGIPKGKIFTINPKGEVVVNNHLDMKSYHSLHALVNGMFPATLSVEQEDFNTWNFWRTPLPDIPG